MEGRKEGKRVFQFIFYCIHSLYLHGTWSFRLLVSVLARFQQEVWVFVKYIKLDMFKEIKFL